MDIISFLINLTIVMLLVLLNGFFVAAEFAMVKVRSTRIEALLVEGNPQAKYAKNLVTHLDAYLSACQLGITLASLGLGWVGEPAVARVIEPILVRFGMPASVIHTISFVIAFSFITALHIILGELAPKSLAIQKSENVTLWTAGPLIGFYKLMYPFIWILNEMANWVLRAIGIQFTGDSEAAHTEDEIRILIKQSHKHGYINQTELTYVDNIFDFTERSAQEVMIPRTDMVCLFAENSFDENLEIALMEQLTRYPVCNPDKDNIIGFVHAKDLLTAVARKKNPTMLELVRSVLAVPESMLISNLLKLMQKNKAHMAIVIDEYGGTAGLVTFEDILEKIVGRIQDEFDEERPLVEIRNDGAFSIDGRMLIEEVNDILGINLETDGVNTLGGWMYSRVEIPPQVNHRVVYDDYEFIVEEVEHIRVKRVLIRSMNSDDMKNVISN